MLPRVDDQATGAAGLWFRREGWTLGRNRLAGVRSCMQLSVGDVPMPVCRKRGTLGSEISVEDSVQDRQSTAVLFVDIVDATALAISLGDQGWAELLERYHALAGSALERHRGWLMDTAGDGFFAIFDDAVDAIRCALELGHGVTPLGIALRAGVHLGHCWRADDKCAGADVHIGARLASAADPGEVLLSEEASRLF